MAGKPPDAATLYEAALTHMARYAATESGLARVLARRVDRWGRRHAEEMDPDELARIIRQAKAEISGVLSRLQALGVLDDAAFAASRAKRLTRGGKSRRATLAHLAAKGVKAPDFPEDPARELAAACAYLRRRRAGPFGPAPADKILAAMGRGGFAHATAKHALALSREEAEALIKALSTPLT